MTPLSASVLCTFLAFCVYLFKRCAKIAWQSLTSPLRGLPGPKGDNIVLGNVKLLLKAEYMEVHERWTQDYGETHIFHGLFNVPILWTMDHRAINHVLTHTIDFQKTEEARRQLGLIIGQGVLVAEGDQHKRQRRIMNPAFGPLQVRELTSIFIEKSLELRDAWKTEITSVGASEPARIDALSWLGRTTLDIIGLAGFNYSFDALQGKASTNELSVAFNIIFEAITKPGLLELGKEIFTPLRLIRTKRDRHCIEAQKVMRHIGLQLIARKKAAILDERGASEKKTGVGQGASGRDLLTLLMRANMAVDVAETQRMTDDEVLGQISTFIVAGHETTSTATAWCLYALTQSPAVQRKLREELLRVSTDMPTMDELVALPYLDMVVKETLRLHAPVPITDREATTDTYIPLSRPYTDKHGKTHDSIRVAKGDPILIPVLFVNQSKELWGEDVLEFKPERWENPPDAITSIPGVWSNLLTFLGGPHSCIGYRFAVVEMKALIFTLVRAFEFDLAVPATDVTKRNMIVTRPVVPGGKDGKEKVHQLPLLVKPYCRT